MLLQLIIKSFKEFHKALWNTMNAITCLVFNSLNKAHYIIGVNKCLNHYSQMTH